MLRLLPKSDIARRRAEEARQRAEEGMRIAGKVDTLRETLSQEEVAFQKFGEESLKTIREDTEKSRQELNQLEADIRNRKEELLSLSGDLDKSFLTFVRSEKAKLESQRKHNDLLTATLAKTIRSAQESTEKSTATGKELELERLRYKRLTASAAEKEAGADKSLKDADKKAAKIIKEAQLETQKANKRLNEAIEYEQHLALEKQRLDTLEQSIEEREWKVLAKELQYYSPVKKI